MVVASVTCNGVGAGSPSKSASIPHTTELFLVHDASSEFFEMSVNSTPRWLEWAREIQALAQSGMHFAVNDFQRKRYEHLNEIAAEIIGEYSSLPEESLLEIFNGQIGYATPRVDVRGAVFHNDKLLLVRERMDDGWTMPGGWASEVAFFGLDEIPSTLSSFRTHPRHIRDAFAVRNDMQWQTVFD